MTLVALLVMVVVLCYSATTDNSDSSCDANEFYHNTIPRDYND